jgi:hypothetical protein
MVFLWVQNKNDPTIAKPATQCKPLAPAGPMLATLQHRSPGTQQLALMRPPAAAYTQHPKKYFALSVKKPLDKSTHELL